MAERTGGRTFAPVAAAGLAGAALAALAATEPWVTGASCAPAASSAGIGEAPGAAAVSLALLASWGALLVTRGRVRRALSLVTAGLGLGLAAAVWSGVRAARDGLVDRSRELGIDCAGTDLTGWFWAAVVALPFAVGAAVAAVRLVPDWPEMGRRYDAPADAVPQPVQPPDERDNLDLWKAIDEGRDPTA